MKIRIIKGLIWGLALGLVAGRVFLPRQNPKGQVLSKTAPTATLTIAPTNTPTATPTPARIATPSVAGRPTPKSQPKFTSEQIYNFTNQYGGQYGVDPNIIRHIALCESGFNPQAKNHIYAGLVQFDTQTWITFRKRMGKDPDPDLRYNAQAEVQTLAYMLSKGYSRLWPNCYPR